MKTPISQSRARNNAKAFNNHFKANQQVFLSKEQKAELFVLESRIEFVTQALETFGSLDEIDGLDMISLGIVKTNTEKRINQLKQS